MRILFKKKNHWQWTCIFEHLKFYSNYIEKMQVRKQASKQVSTKLV